MKNKINMYVFRIAKGHESEKPVNEYPIDMAKKEDDIRKKLNWKRKSTE